MQAIIEQKLKQLPPNLHEEVIDFIDFLISKKVGSCGLKGEAGYHQTPEKV